MAKIFDWIVNRIVLFLVFQFWAVVAVISPKAACRGILETVHKAVKKADRGSLDEVIFKIRKGE